MELKERIEKVLSEILSDKHECKVTLRFEPKEKHYEIPENKQSNQKKKAIAV